jgi:dihydrolipoamide dehydrogenase
MQNKFDLIVIGAGPGGYVAAIRAAQLGLKVAIVESTHLGGVCLNWGCIPTKALLKCSEINHLLHNLDSYGFTAKEVAFDFEKIIARSRGVAATLSNGISILLKKNKIEVFNGFASFKNKNQINVKSTKETQTLDANYFIIATGAKARIIPGFEPDETHIWTYRKAMVPTTLPKSILVVGSGAIGVEFASFYRQMGSEVILIEMAEQILPVEDAEIAKLATQNFEKQGIKIHTKTTIESIKKNQNSVTINLKTAEKIQQIEVEKIIMAVGIVPNTENIGLENTQIKLNNGRIEINQHCNTAESNIYAIGDVVAGPWLAHKASHEANIAAETIASKLDKYNPKKLHTLNVSNIPGCTYSFPQIASIGITEKKAKELNLKVKIGKFPYQANGKAIAIGETFGLIKVIFAEETGELLGAHLIGADATEMIQIFALAKQAELTEAELMQTVFAHPTLGEMLHEAVLSAYGQAIHF